MKTFFKLLVLTSLMAMFIVSCGKKADDASAKSESTAANVVGDFALDASGVAFTLGGNAVELAGVTFVPASEWTDFGPSGMRKASYALNAIKGEADSATVTVFYFGEGGGGTIEANLSRWVGQMALAEGVDPATAVQRGTMTADGMNVHLIQVNGAYNAGGMMSGASVKKENYAMVGAVLEAPLGNIFFKLTGPAKTANAMAEAMIGMLEGTTKL